VNQNEVRFEDATGGQYIGLKAASTVSSSITFTLPTADGTSGQALTTNGSGTLSFADAGPFSRKGYCLCYCFLI
jgi:hypothetical protein